MEDKINPEVGKTYRLDKGFRNSSIIEVVKVGKLFCRIKLAKPNGESNGEWDTMISRLSADETTNKLLSFNNFKKRLSSFSYFLKKLIRISFKSSARCEKRDSRHVSVRDI